MFLAYKPVSSKQGDPNGLGTLVSSPPLVFSGLRWGLEVEPPCGGLWVLGLLWPLLHAGVKYHFAASGSDTGSIWMLERPLLMVDSHTEKVGWVGWRPWVTHVILGTMTPWNRVLSAWPYRLKTKSSKSLYTHSFLRSHKLLTLFCNCRLWLNIGTKICHEIAVFILATQSLYIKI